MFKLCSALYGMYFLNSGEFVQMLSKTEIINC